MTGNPRVINGPIKITATATGTNIPASAAGVNPPNANTYHIVKHIRLTNEDGSARTVSLYKGATTASAAGTAICVAKSIPANDYIDIYFPSGDKYATTDYMVGWASVTNVVSIAVYGDIQAV
jgi:hypothetical protein